MEIKENPLNLFYPVNKIAEINNPVLIVIVYSKVDIKGGVLRCQYILHYPVECFSAYKIIRFLKSVKADKNGIS